MVEYHMMNSVQLVFRVVCYDPSYQSIVLVVWGERTVCVFKVMILSRVSCHFRTSLSDISNYVTVDFIVAIAILFTLKNSD